MTLQANSLAAAVGSTVKNVQFQPSANNIPRKILLIGTYDPAKTAVVDEVPKLVLSPEDVGSQTGFGFMLHRLAVQSFLGGNGVETWMIPQSEVGTAGAGEIDFAGSTGILAGTMWLYIAGISVPISITAAMTVEEIADAVVAAITSDTSLPVTATKTAVTFEVVLMSKSKGPWGNEITIKFNIKSGEVLPTGVIAAITDMIGGATNPDIADALDSLGTGDDANEAFFTDVVHGYGQETATLDALETYVGQGNDFIGLYDKLVGRPFRVLTGDIATGSAALSALVALGDGRKLDRANGVVCVPGSANHPSEIAAQSIGYMAKINNDRAAQSYIGVQLIDIDPGEKSDRWTSEYDNRDIAVKAGVSPTKIANGVVVLQNIVTFYHPDNVPVDSNGYRSMRNISILQNMIANVRITFEQEKWLGISIVEDVTRVTSTIDRQKARDIDAVKDDLTALAKAFYAKAWIFTDSFTIDKLKEVGSVEIRPGAIGFNSILSVILSGEGGILDTVTEFDTSIAVLTQ